MPDNDHLANGRICVEIHMAISNFGYDLEIIFIENR